MNEKIFLILLPVLAFITVNTSKLRRAVIYMGLFSLASSFAFLFYGAPDVAIAEAVIGSALSTVLYLVALKKYQVITIYYTNHDYNKIDDRMILRGRAFLLRDIEKYFTGKDLEPQIIYTTEDYLSILENQNYDVLIDQDNEKVMIYGGNEDCHIDEMENYLDSKVYENLDISIIRKGAGVCVDA